MAERRKVYISTGEFQYNKKYQIPYTGYVIGLGYAYVTDCFGLLQPFGLRSYDEKMRQRI